MENKITSKERIVPKKVVSKKIVQPTTVKKKMVPKTPVKKVVQKVPVKKPVALRGDKLVVHTKKSVPESKQTKIKILGIQDLLKSVGNKDFFEIYNVVKKKSPTFFAKGFSGTFGSKKEIKAFFRDRIFDFLKSEYDDYRSTITELRKGGEEVMFLDLKSLSIPLKMKVLRINFSLEEFSSLFSLMEFVDSSLKNIKNEREKREEEAKRLEKIRQEEKKKTIPKKVVSKKIVRPTTVKKKMVPKTPIEKVVQKVPVKKANPAVS